MLRLGLPAFTDRPFRLLCLGAHPDDIEIGAAATIGRLLASYERSDVRWVVLSGTPERAAEATASARALVAGEATLDLTLGEFRDGYLAFHGAEVKEALAVVRDGFAPDLIIAPRPDDLHQDHALVGALTHQLFRDHLILSYEIAKTDGDLVTPNLYVPIDRDEVEAKIAHLAQHFSSQSDRAWFEPEAFRALMRVRGLEASAPSGYAEAFHARRIVVQV